MSITRFLAYNNTVPVALALMLLGGSGAFAATNPEIVFSQQQAVITVDNTYIAAKDLSSWTPTALITGVTEDSEKYFIAYTLSTIDISNYVWQDVTKAMTLEVPKSVIGAGVDLGNYASAQLKEMIDGEMRRLADTQAFERKQVTQKTVATSYGGLVGKMLDASTETLPGYVPVVATVSQADVQQTAAVSGAGTAPASQSAAVQSSSAPKIQILGANPARIPLKTAYVDLGAIVTDDKNNNLGIHYFVNGKEVQWVEIDTQNAGTVTIRYESTDADGNSGFAERTVEIYDPNPVVVTQQAPVSENGTTTTEQ